MNDLLTLNKTISYSFQKLYKGWLIRKWHQKHCEGVYVIVSMLRMRMYLEVRRHVPYCSHSWKHSISYFCGLNKLTLLTETPHAFHLVLSGVSISSSSSWKLWMYCLPLCLPARCTCSYHVLPQGGTAGVLVVELAVCWQEDTQLPFSPLDRV